MDQTITIRNKKTGEVKTITVDQARQLGFDDKFILDKLKSSAELEQAISSPETLTKTSEQSAKQDEDLSKAKLISDQLGAIGKYFEPGSSLSTGRLGSKLEKAQSVLGLDPSLRSFEQDINVAAPVIGKNILELDRLTDEDVILAKESLPKASDTPQEARKKITTLRNILVTRYGEEFASEALPTESKPEDKRTASEKVISGGLDLSKKAGSKILNFLLGSSIRTAKDIGTGLAERSPDVQRARESEAKALEASKELTQMAMKTDDKEKKEKLLNLARQIDQRIGKGFTPEYSESIEQPYALRGATTGAEIAATAEIPALMKAVIKKTPGLAKLTAGEARKKLLPKQAGIALRDEAIMKAQQAGKTIKGDKLLTSVDDWAAKAKRAFPKDRAAIEKFQQGAKLAFKDKKLTPQEAKDIWDLSQKGFQASGRTGKTLEGFYHRSMRDILRTELERIAPGFEKGTQMIRGGFERSKKVQKYATLLSKLGLAYGGARVGLEGAKAVVNFEGE